MNLDQEDKDSFESIFAKNLKPGIAFKEEYCLLYSKRNTNGFGGELGERVLVVEEILQNTEATIKVKVSLFIENKKETEEREYRNNEYIYPIDMLENLTESKQNEKELDKKLMETSEALRESLQISSEQEKKFKKIKEEFPDSELINQIEEACFPYMPPF